jgi:DNA invertase Pin-like site-specific DNA recombinase
MGEKNITEIKYKINPFSMPAKIKVCAYVRVSTDNIGQLNSLKNQTEYYERKLQSNSAYEYCGIFSDAGISGAKENRPGFQTMLEKARAGEINLIVTKSISRFARNTLMLLQYVRELKEMGVGVIFEEQDINTLNSEGELMLSVLGAIATEERKAVCANVQWTMQSKFKRGEVMVDTNRLLGYDRDENNNLVINEKQAYIIRWIYKLYLAGASGCKIAQVLNDENIPTFTDKPWSSSRVLSIISNEKYVGDCLMQKSYVNDEGREVINKGQKAKYYMKDVHPAIISREDWEKAQIIRKSRKKKTYPFTSLLHCPYCGASLIRVAYQGGWVSWICATYMQKGKAVCIGMRIAEGKLRELTKDKPITEPMVLEEVNHGKHTKKRSEKDFRLIPVAQYCGFRES